MKTKSMKLKAAITGVIYYLQQQDNDSKTQEKHWSVSGRKMIMRNRSMVQRRGLTR